MSKLVCVTALALGIIGTSLGGCASGDGSATGDQTSAMEAKAKKPLTCMTRLKDPKDIPVAMAESFNMGARGKIGECYTDHGQLVGSHVPVVAGKEAIVKTYTELQKAGLQIKVPAAPLPIVDVLPENPTSANVYGPYEIYDADGKMIDKGNSMIHAEYVGGRWLASIDTYMTMK